MSDEPEQIPADAPSPDARVDAPPPVEPELVAEPAAASTSGASAMGGTPASEDPHPEYQVAAAFAGAFLFAKLLSRVGRRK